MRDARRRVTAVVAAVACLLSTAPVTAVTNNLTFTSVTGSSTVSGTIVMQPGGATTEITDHQFTHTGTGSGIHQIANLIPSNLRPGTNSYISSYRSQCQLGQRALSDWSLQLKPTLKYTHFDDSFVSEYQAPPQRSYFGEGGGQYTSNFVTMADRFSGLSPYVGQVTNGQFAGDVWQGILRYAGEFGAFRVASGLGSGQPPPQMSYAARSDCTFSVGAFNTLSSNTYQNQFVAIDCPEICYKPLQTDNWLRETPFCLDMQQPGMGRATGPAPADMPSQWAFKKLGLPLRLPVAQMHEITVAVIDSGLHYRHPAFKPENLWHDPRPDDPRYPGARFGWNFVDGHNNPADDAGHGTFVSGLILAINPKAKIMPIKVLNRLGSGRSTDIAQAIVFAIERGARIINLSVGAKGMSALTQEVVDYARRRGVLIVVAAGNEGVDVAGYVPSGARGVLTVAPTDADDRKPPFGNWGQNVAIAAPGVDIVSWRAAWSDFVLVATGGKDYKPGENIVGQDGWLYRASGSSFAAPFVAGAASLILALRPNLTGAQVARMLVSSADDIEVPGWDQFTGAGRLNIVRSIFADPNYYLTVRVARVGAGQRAGQPVVEVHGTVDGNMLASYQVQLGQGDNPTSWKTVGTERGKSVAEGLIAAFPVREITARGKWSIRVVAQDSEGRTREARGTLNVQ